jgi:hypothetical protein
VRPSGERILLNNFHGGPGAPRFSEFRQGYVFQDGGGLAGPNVERHIRVVGIDGTVLPYKLPKGEWMSGTVFGVPVHSAVLMVSLAIPKGDGVYLVRGRRVERIIKGYTAGNFAVSADGCKVAMSLRPGDYEDDSVVRNVVLNTCERGN